MRASPIACTAHARSAIPASSVAVALGLTLATTPARAAPARAEARAEPAAAQATDARARASAPAPLDVSGYVQVDWVTFRQSSRDEVTQDGQPLNEDRFVLRRARLRAERDQGLLHAALELDANTIAGPQVRPMGVEASFKYPADRPYARRPWAIEPTSNGTASAERAPLAHVASTPWFMVTAGMFRTPFGFEVAEADRDRPWLERSAVSNALFPQSQDLGLRILGGFRFVRYAFAVMNGDPIGERTFPGRDPNQSKDIMFRVGFATAVSEAIELEGGVSGLSGRGFHRGQPATKDVLQWQDANDDGVVDGATELHVIPGAPATPSANFKRFAVGADLRAKASVPVLGALYLQAEIVRGNNLDRGLFVSDPIATTRDLRQLGWYVGATQELTRWALVGVRHDRYDPDADAREQEPFAVVPRDATIATWAFIAAARTNGARLLAEYDHRQNTSGRDASGRPTTLADDAFTLRMEVGF